MQDRETYRRTKLQPTTNRDARWTRPMDQNQQGQFWFIPKTSFINATFRENFYSIKGDISRFFDFPYKEVFNPIPYNYFLSNQTCLHGDRCLDFPISRSMLCFNYLGKNF